jgi:hypothetical protein
MNLGLTVASVLQAGFYLIKYMLYDLRVFLVQKNKKSDEMFLAVVKRKRY